MDALAPDISDLILDLVALDRSSLIQLSSVSKFFRRRLSPRIFSKLSIKSILIGEDTVHDRVERLLGFIKTSDWNGSVESIGFEMRLPDLQKRMLISIHCPGLNLLTYTYNG